MTPKKRRPAASLWLALLAAPACHVVRDDAPALLAQGRYEDALDALRAREADARSLEGPERARYALYRGLAHLALGDGPAAGRWLGEAKACFDADPRCLSEADAGRLEGAWRGMGRGF
ncbi:MAG TPA: hypothetical protein VFS43_12295 [Polyangiaceae bacterium]|nr:hypothetical protein [Polyangiaceae bacterium]